MSFKILQNYEPVKITISKQVMPIYGVRVSSGVIYAGCDKFQMGVGSGEGCLFKLHRTKTTRIASRVKIEVLAD